MPRIDREKLLSIAVGRRTRDRVVYGRDENGYATKATTDELNNTVTEHADGRQDVLIRAPRVVLRAQEEPHG